MKFIWRSIDSVFGYAGVFERATPVDRVRVAVATARVLGRRHVVDPLRRAWHRLHHPQRIIDRLERVGGRSGGSGWYRLPATAYHALRDIQRTNTGYVQLWQDRLLLIDARGQVIGCANDDDPDETYILLIEP